MYETISVALLASMRGSRGLMDRASDLEPEVCGFESLFRQELSTTEVRPLSKAPNYSPGAATLAAHCSRCVCTWMG